MPARDAGYIKVECCKLIHFTPRVLAGWPYSYYNYGRSTIPCVDGRDPKEQAGGGEFETRGQLRPRESYSGAHSKDSSYQFKKKSNEIQFHFNSEVEEAITSAKKELEKVNTSDGAIGTREVIKKAETHLDRDLKALDKRQKHICVVNHSEFGWATVEFYESLPLATDADDEKRLEKAEKEAEQAANKHCCGGGSASKRKCGYVATGPQSSRPSREPQVAA